MRLTVPADGRHRLSGADLIGGTVSSLTTCMRREDAAMWRTRSPLIVSNANLKRREAALYPRTIALTTSWIGFRRDD